jgi:hypothetical protein
MPFFHFHLAEENGLELSSLKSKNQSEYEQTIR